MFNINRFRSFSGTLCFLLVSAFTWLMTPALFAADDVPQTAFQWVQKGGIVIIILAIALLAAIALIIFNLLQLTRARFVPADLQARLLEHMQACRVRSAIGEASESPTFLGRMLAVALPKVDATDPETLGRTAVEDAMADFTMREKAGYMANLGYLGVIAQAAPMLGLLGTVFGMIKAFAKLMVMKTTDASQLAGAIAEALVTTAGGLVVALLCIIPYFYLRNRLNKLIGEAHSVSGDMLDASLASLHQDTQLSKVPEGLAH